MYFIFIKQNSLLPLFQPISATLITDAKELRQHGILSQHQSQGGIHFEAETVSIKVKCEVVKRGVCTIYPRECVLVKEV